MGTLGAVLSILRGDAPPAVRIAASKPVSYTARPWGGPVRSTIRLEHEAQDFSASAIAYRCIQTIVTNLAAVDMTVRLPSGEVNDDHPVARLWNRGTPGAPFSGRVMREVALTQREVTGEAFIYIDRGSTGLGEAAGLWPIFDPMEIVVDKDHQLAGFVVKVNGTTRVPLLPSEVLWLRYPHPFKPWESLPPWKAARWPVQADAYARAWQEGEFKNGARPSALVYLGALDEEQYAAAKAEYKLEIEGPGNAGRAMLIASSADAMGGEGQAPSVARLSLTPAEMSYLESRARNAEEVMVAFGIPKDVILGQATYENQRAAKTALWSDRLVPSLDVLGSEIDRQLLPDVDEEVAWDLSNVDALADSTDALFSRARDAAYIDVAQLDELRALLGWEPLPNGLGQYTLTHYRAIVTAMVAADPTLGGAPMDPERSLLPQPRRMLRAARAGRYFVPRPARRTTPAPVLVQRGAVFHTRAGLTPKRVLAIYDRHERIGKKAVARLAARQEKAVLRELQKATRAGMLAADEHTAHRAHLGSLRLTAALAADTVRDQGDVDLLCDCTRVAADEVFDPEFWRAETARALEAFLEGAWVEGGQRAADGLGLGFDVFDESVLEAMERRRDVLADRVTRTTRAVLDAQLLQAGVEGGESVDELADRIRAVFSDLSTWRAETIARTETVGGYNAASHVVARESGLVVKRQWLATLDDRTRASHSRINGETVDGTDSRYSNGLLHPGDPSGPARETVRCRCVEIFIQEDE